MNSFLSKTDFNYTEKAFYSIKIEKSPTEKQNSIQVEASLLERKDSMGIHPINDKHILLYFEKDSSAFSLTKGDVLQIYTALESPINTSPNPASFDYARYLRIKGICATGYVNQYSWEKVRHIDTFSILSFAESIRLHLLSIYKKHNITDDDFGILAALTLGYRQDISPDVRETFSDTGAMHILAVSGLHVGIIMYVLSLLLFPLNRTKHTKRIKSLIIICLLWCYAFITGLSPSVTRATIMFSLISFAPIINRHSSTYNTIFLSAFCILLLKPNSLFEIGFQLSYSAVLAIVYFYPKISDLFHPKNRCVKWVWDLLCVSLTAQIGTAPFVLYYFHQFPNYFLLTNFLAIPAATLIIYTAVLFFCVSWIPYIGSCITFLLKALLKLFYWLISYIGSFPNATSHIWLGEFETFLLYFIIIGFVFCLEYKNFKSYVSLLSLILLFFAFQCYQNYQSFTKQQVFVFQHNKYNLINFISGKENYVITNDSVASVQLAQNLWLRENTVIPTIIPDSMLHRTAFVSDGERYICLTRSLPYRWQSSVPLEVDHLIVARKLYADSLLFSNVHSHDVIITKNVPKYAQQRIRNASNKYGISIK